MRFRKARLFFKLSPENTLRLYAGILSFVCAETLTAASLCWVINPIAYLLAFPLYLIHVLFFYSLAYHLSCRSLQQLYLFGMLFALYETWVTKVLWAGYPGEDGFITGAVLGHGIHETLVLIFYFHPVVAFLFPLILIGSFFPQVSEEIGIQKEFWAKGRLFPFVFWFSFIILSIGTAIQFKSPGQLLLHWIPTFIIVWFGHRYARKAMAGKMRSEVRFALSRRGTVIAAILILLMYILTYFFLLPERLPALWVQGITLLMYAGVIASLCYLKPEKKDAEQDIRIPAPKFFFYTLLWFAAITTVVYVMNMFIPQAIFVIASLGFLFMMIVGILLFYRLVIRNLSFHS